jgi:hypothetical protein
MIFDLQYANAGVSNLVCVPTMMKALQSESAHPALRPIFFATARSIIQIRNLKNGNALNVAP